MGVFNLDSEEFKPPKEVTQSLAQVTCPGYKVEQSQELLTTSSWPFPQSSGPDAGKQEPSAKGLATSNQLNPKDCRGQT